LRRAPQDEGFLTFSGKVRPQRLGLLILAALSLADATHAAERCDAPLAYQDTAAKNASSLTTLVFAPFGRPETGWVVYAPRIAEEIRTDCGPDTPRFAHALARWRTRHRLGHTGVLDDATFEVMKTAWQARRPFVMERKAGVCPDAPELMALEAAGPEESDGGKIILLRPAALAALRRMTADARAEVPEASADPERLMLFSGFRAPADDAARCEAQGNCNGLVRAQCSSHRTGLAMDLVLGAAPGFDVDSSADANRLWQTETPTYRWLVKNARRYGFVNYVFEPWHWEWVGRSK
jgi:LAS superfamily LD-carboxypeptidase LdcB